MKLRLALAAVILTVLVACGGTPNQHGCILVRQAGVAVPRSWTWDRDSGIWWDTDQGPTQGFVGVSTTYEGDIWNAIPGVSATWCAQTGGGN